jgi:hypothetical protein
MAEQPEEPDKGPHELPKDFVWGQTPPGFPDEFTSPLREGSNSLHEMYLSHIKSGFLPEQALYLVAAMITGNPGKCPPNVNDEED